MWALRKHIYTEYIYICNIYLLEQLLHALIRQSRGRKWVLESAGKQLPRAPKHESPLMSACCALWVYAYIIISYVFVYIYILYIFICVCVRNCVHKFMYVHPTLYMHACMLCVPGQLPYMVWSPQTPVTLCCSSSTSVTVANTSTSGAAGAVVLVALAVVLALLLLCH